MKAAIIVNPVLTGFHPDPSISGRTDYYWQLDHGSGAPAPSKTSSTGPIVCADSVGCWTDRHSDSGDLAACLSSNDGLFHLISPM